MCVACVCVACVWRVCGVCVRKDARDTRRVHSIPTPCMLIRQAKHQEKVVELKAQIKKARVPVATRT